MAINLIMSKVHKKRGRKPKGGKIIEIANPNDAAVAPPSNIILHLRCNKSDIIMEETSEPNIQGFGFEPEPHTFVQPTTDSTSKDIWSKVRNLSISLQTNRASDTNSACFWCTCEFNTPTIYIPKHQLCEEYQCYGCFCSPECATAYLFDEKIEQAVVFERYGLLNHIYGKIYDYSKNILPAPNPRYMLKKFCGELTIDEYRSLSQHERLLLVIDKPLSRCLPEVYEEGTIETFGIKMRARETTSKADILKKNFMGGITA